MPFKLEAVFAKEGDSLLLHYGSDDDPSILLIDGGSHGVYADWLRPRLQQLRDELGERVPLQMIMISHVDSDHLTGILDLFEELQESDDPVCDVGSLWHNSFDDLVGNEASELTTAILQSLADGNQPESADPDSSAVAASVAQGRRLRQDAEALGISTNDRFTGLVIASPETVGPIDLGDGMTFRVLGPSLARVEALQGVWNRYLEEKELAEAVAAGLEDNSIPNLSSLVVLAEQDGKTMLLTGDARGDYIVEGLILAGLLPPEAELPILYTGMPRAERATKKMELAAAEAMENPPSVHLDLLKLPHHGSDRNVEHGVLPAGDGRSVSLLGGRQSPQSRRADPAHDRRRAGERSLHALLHLHRRPAPGRIDERRVPSGSGRSRSVDSAGEACDLHRRSPSPAGSAVGRSRPERPGCLNDFLDAWAATTLQGSTLRGVATEGRVDEYLQAHQLRDLSTRDSTQSNKE